MQCHHQKKDDEKCVLPVVATIRTPGLIAGHRDALRPKRLADFGKLLRRKDLAERLLELRGGHVIDVGFEFPELAELADRRVCGLDGGLHLLFRGRLRLGHCGSRGKNQSWRRKGGSKNACDCEEAKCLHKNSSLRKTKTMQVTYWHHSK